MDVERWLEQFRQYLVLQSFSAETVKNYAFLARRLLLFLVADGLQRMTDLTTERLETYCLTLLARRTSVSRRYLCQHYCAMKAFTRFLYQQHHLLLDPGRDIPMPPRPPLRPLRVLSEAEVERLLDAPDLMTPRGLRDRAILELFYSTALRNTELRRLAVRDVDLERELVSVWFGKGGKSRVVPLGGQAAHWVEEYLLHSRPKLVKDPVEDRLFLSARGRGLSLNRTVEMVSGYASTVGLPQRVTPHLLRHSCATHMLRRGAGIRHLQELLGHACAETTQRYTQVTMTDLKRVHQRCHPRERRTP